jgi:hypothetical protein
MRAGGQRITFWNGATVMRKIIELNTVIELSTEETKVVAGGLERRSHLELDSGSGFGGGPSGGSNRNGLPIRKF